MPKATDRDSILGGCIYVADMGLEDCMYALQVGLMPDIDSVDIPKAVGVP